MIRRRNPPWPQQLEGRRLLGSQRERGYFGFESNEGKRALPRGVWEGLRACKVEGLEREASV
jgi:hypothetical protein